MTRGLINKLISDGTIPEETFSRNLIETHISWVLLCDEFVYKIKRPVRYSFVDFSSLKKRKHYCEREITLNQRYSDGIYLDCVPIRSDNQHITIGQGEGEIIDFCVKMRKLPSSLQMNNLLTKDLVRVPDVCRLAGKIARFHMTAQVLYKKNVNAIKKEFNDLAKIKTLITDVKKEQAEIIDRALFFSNNFINENKDIFIHRLQAGFVRDCHGDLHSGNIFLLPEPLPFDCIEFNDDLRQIDILSEIAFLCMDLEFFGKTNLSELFLNQYCAVSDLAGVQQNQSLFNYYKIYRANVRAKVHALEAMEAGSVEKKESAICKCSEYLELMNKYLNRSRN